MTQKQQNTLKTPRNQAASDLKPTSSNQHPSIGRNKSKPARHDDILFLKLQMRT
jgi:hypothetical protein